MRGLSDVQYAAVLRLSAEYRLAHFQSALRAGQTLYIVVDAEGPCLLEDVSPDSDGQRCQMLPVFSHERFAAGYIAARHLEGAQVRAVSTDAFREHWQPFLTAHGIVLGVMPAGDDCCVLDTLDDEF